MLGLPDWTLEGRIKKNRGNAVAVVVLFGQGATLVSVQTNKRASNVGHPVSGATQEFDQFSHLDIVEWRRRDICYQLLECFKIWLWRRSSIGAVVVNVVLELHCLYGKPCPPIDLAMSYDEPPNK